MAQKGKNLTGHTRRTSEAWWRCAYRRRSPVFLSQVSREVCESAPQALDQRARNKFDRWRKFLCD